MSTFNQRPYICQILEVSCVDRWQVYRRLQELEIDCWCEAEKPLQVHIKNTNEATQLESVLKQFTAHRQELAKLLQSCWEVS
ncbi:MAG: Asr1405/Asl0597 family protein [Cyanobacteria bacterium P01_H01_bin.35]